MVDYAGAIADQFLSQRWIQRGRLADVQDLGAASPTLMLVKILCCTLFQIASAWAPSLPKRTREVPS